MSQHSAIQVERIAPTHTALKIAVVTETYPPDINGVAHTLSKIVLGLRERGHLVWLVRPLAFFVPFATLIVFKLVLLLFLLIFPPWLPLLLLLLSLCNGAGGATAAGFTGCVKLRTVCTIS